MSPRISHSTWRPLRRCFHWTTAIAVLFVAAGCGSSATTSLGPSATAKCQVSVTGGQLSVGAAGGAGSVTVSAEPECAWTASSEANWLSGFAPASGQGAGEIKFQVAPNPGSAGRQADIALNNATARVTQAGAPCRIEITPRRQTVPAQGGSGTVTVATLSGCTWTVTSSASWLTASAGGTGPGTVTFAASPNGGGARSATLTIADQTFVVTQSAVGAVQCTYTLQPGSASVGAGGGTVTIAVRTGGGCSWATASETSWLTVEGSGTGSGNGSVTIRAAANTGAARSGSVTIAEQTFTVAQAGVAGPAPQCTYAFAPSSRSIPAGGGSSSVVVQTTGACSWTVASSAPWLTVTSGGTGTGNGTVAFDVSANTGPARSATLSVPGQTFTVNQDGGCTVSIDPTSATASSAGGAGGPIAVTAGANCGWTATEDTDWIAITSGASGTGDGTVRYTVDANTGTARTGTITIGTNTFTVSQDAPAPTCTYAIDPTSMDVGDGPSTSDPITVTAPTGCGWTATSNDGWIQVESGATGSGNGTVTFSVSRNNGDDPRVGTLTIAGQTFTVTQAAD
jgi:hypothetical protein